MQYLCSLLIVETLTNSWVKTLRALSLAYMVQGTVALCCEYTFDYWHRPPDRVAGFLNRQCSPGLAYRTRFRNIATENRCNGQILPDCKPNQSELNLCTTDPISFERSLLAWSTLLELWLLFWIDLIPMFLLCKKVFESHQGLEICADLRNTFASCTVWLHQLVDIYMWAWNAACCSHECL